MNEPCILDEIAGILHTHITDDTPIVFGTFPSNAVTCITLSALTFNRDHGYGSVFIPNYDVKIVIRGQDLNTAIEMSEKVTTYLEMHPAIRLFSSDDPHPINSGDIFSVEITNIYKITGDL